MTTTADTATPTGYAHGTAWVLTPDGARLVVYQLTCHLTWLPDAPPVALVTASVSDHAADALGPPIRARLGALTPEHTIVQTMRALLLAERQGLDGTELWQVVYGGTLRYEGEAADHRFTVDTTATVERAR